MAQEWFYTKDGKTKIGPVSSTQLRALARARQIVSTDMVWQPGINKWTAAGAIKGLFTDLHTTPKPAVSAAAPAKLAGTIIEPAHRELAQGTVVPYTEPFPPPATLPVAEVWLTAENIRRLALGLAVFFSLLAAVLAVTRVGGELLAPFIAGLGILASFIAVAVGLSARERLVYLGSAATAVFLGLASLLISIGSTIFTHKIDEAKDYLAKAEPLMEEHRKAKKARADAQKAKDDAVAEPIRLMKQYDEQMVVLNKQRAVLKKEDEDLAVKRKEITEENANLDSKREKIKEEDASLDTKRAGIQKQEQALAKREDELKIDRDKLNNREKDLNVAIEKAKNDLKSAEAAEKRSNIQREQAEAKNKEAEKKLQEAKGHYKKIEEETEKIRKKLTVVPRKDRQAAIDMVKRIGPLPQPIKSDLTDLNQDLCHDLCVAMFLPVKIPNDVGERMRDEVVQKNALSALEIVEPKLGLLIKEVRFPAKDISVEDYVALIERLPDFGRAGLPLLKVIEFLPTTKDEVRIATRAVIKKIEEKSK